MKKTIVNSLYPISFSLLVLLIITIIGIRKSPRFPKTDSVNVIFREQFLSGRSSRLMSRYRNILEVVVTDQEFWIRPFILFFPFAAFFNDIHRIPISSIQKIETRRDETIIYLLNSKGFTVHFSIYFKNPKAFIKSVEQFNKSVKIQSNL